MVFYFTLSRSVQLGRHVNLHYINITSIFSISVHFEMHPLNTNLSYLLIYKFDQIPQLNNSINQIDGSTLLCPFNLTNESTSISDEKLFSRTIYCL